MFLCNFPLILLKVNTVCIAAKSTEDFSKGEDGSFSNDVIASNTREMEKQRKRLDKELKQRLFSQVSKKMVEALYQKYRVDFTMFEYDIDEYIQIASPSEGLMPEQM